MIVPVLNNVKHIIKNPFLNINFYNKAAIPFIAYNIIIGPHGVTDLLYAFEYKKIFQLITVYSFTSLFSRWLYIKQYETVINSLFLVLSSIHFKNDIPINNKYIQLFFSTLFVLNLKTIGLPVFLLYMSLIHVPNHYLTYNELTSKYKYLSYFMLSFVSILLCKNYATINENTSWIVKSLIISHILFEELYSKKKHKNILNYLFYKNDSGKNMAIYI